MRGRRQFSLPGVDDIESGDRGAENDELRKLRFDRPCKLQCPGNEVVGLRAHGTLNLSMCRGPEVRFVIECDKYRWPLRRATEDSGLGKLLVKCPDEFVHLNVRILHRRFGLER